VGSTQWRRSPRPLGQPCLGLPDTSRMQLTYSSQRPDGCRKRTQLPDPLHAMDGTPSWTLLLLRVCTGGSQIMPDRSIPLLSLAVP
jgi:hypothetical protein